MRLSDLASLNARRHAGKAAISFKGTSHTFKQFDERLNQTVRALQATGCERGDRIAVISDGTPEVVELFFAAARGGFVLVPLNYRLTPKELAYIVNDASAKVLIAKSEFIDKMAAIRDELGSVQRFFRLDGADSGGWDSYSKLVDGCSADEVLVSTAADDVVWLLYTSGTTGLPKAVMLTQAGLDAAAMTIPYGFDGMNRDDRGLVCTPPYALSFASPILGHWYSGSSVTIHEKFEPAAVLRTIEEDRITLMMVVPTMLKVLIEHPDFFRHDLSSLRSVYYVGAPASTDLKRQLFHAFREKLLQGYGLTEAGGPLTLLEKSDHRRADKLASVGRPYPGVDLRLVDEQDRDVPNGEPGEVIFKSDLTMKGYWNSPEVNAKTIRSGWVYTGDVAKMDDEGYLYLVDRKKDMVVTGGTNVFPREIENVINSHPGVLESAVIGVPDEHWGEILKAIIVRQPASSVDEAAITEFCRQTLAAFKTPKQIEFADELPKNIAGKVLKGVLREQHARQQPATRRN